MNGTGTRFALGALALLLAGAVAVPEALASVGRVEFAIGDVSATDARGARRPVSKGSSLEAGDTVVTGRGRVQIRFSDGGYTSLQPGTEFRIDEYDYDTGDRERSRSFFSLLKGGLRTITGVIGKINKKAYQIRTPVATIGIRGTEYLASLGDSLTVHVGAGEIEVCSDLSCASFGAHQTGYVPGAGSPPVQVQDPPSLTPPQERQNYAYNGGYENAPESGATYSRNDDVGGDGISDVLDVPLSNGPRYAIAVSWGNIDFVADHFAKGLLDPPGDLVDARFDENGGLLKYYAPNTGAGSPVQGEVDLNGNGVIDGTEARFADVGSTAGVIGWGRWTDGDALVGASGGGSSLQSFAGSSSHHYVIGVPTADMPGGSATYSLVGATSPTLGGGGAPPGVVNSASLSANFDLARVSLDMNLAVGGIPYAVNVPNMTIGSGRAPLVNPNDFTFAGVGLATNGADCISAGCSTAVEGYFAGTGASHAGLGYKIATQSDNISGAAAFKKN